MRRTNSKAGVSRSGLPAWHTPTSFCLESGPVGTRLRAPNTATTLWWSITRESCRGLAHSRWKKVTTNVSNFIMGAPIIDHYGDLIVSEYRSTVELSLANHRTGDTCTLTFKPRTWRGKDAMEIKGQVQDANGRKVWDIAGRKSPKDYS